tara:strand:- start:36648 stop:36875 length:228 start_codon:yes stop_codon:yes gene_type:complete
MKKIKLKDLKIRKGDLLEREELKIVFGGYEDSGCNQPLMLCTVAPSGFSDTCCGNSVCVADPGYEVFGHCSGILV